jgi:hypothetical protein
MHPVVARSVAKPINNRIFFIYSFVVRIVFWGDVTRRMVTSPWGVTLSIKNHSWGKHPMAARGLSCFHLAMADQLFFHHLRSAENKPPWPKLDQTTIQPNWNEDVAETIQIRLNRIEAATRIYRISLRPVYRQGHDSQLVPGSRCKRIFASRLERRAI